MLKSILQIEVNLKWLVRSKNRIRAKFYEKMEGMNESELPYRTRAKWILKLEMLQNY